MQNPAMFQNQKYQPLFTLKIPRSRVKSLITENSPIEDKSIKISLKKYKRVSKCTCNFLQCKSNQTTDPRHTVRNSKKKETKNKKKERDVTRKAKTVSGFKMGWWKEGDTYIYISNYIKSVCDFHYKQQLLRVSIA